MKVVLAGHLHDRVVGLEVVLAHGAVALAALPLESMELLDLLRIGRRRHVESARAELVSIRSTNAIQHRAHTYAVCSKSLLRSASRLPPSHCSFWMLLRPGVLGRIIATARLHGARLTYGSCALRLCMICCTSCANGLVPTCTAAGIVPPPIGTPPPIGAPPPTVNTTVPFLGTLRNGNGVGS